MEDGYYWYIPASIESDPALQEKQPAKVSQDKVYFCGSNKAYEFSELYGRLVRTAPPIPMAKPRNMT